jgi:CDP-diglyceride synthetase
MRQIQQEFLQANNTGTELSFKKAAMAKKSVKSRLIFGSLMILVLGGLMWADIHFYNAMNAMVKNSGEAGLSVMDCLLGHGLIITVLAALMALGGSYEVISLAKSTGAKPHSRVVIPGCVLLAIAPILIPFLPAILLPNSKENFWLFPLIADSGLWLGGLAMLAIVAQFIRKSTERAGTHVAWSVFTLLYMGLLIGYAVAVRRDFGPWMFILMIAAVKGSDIGAYFTGINFGKRKLIPWLSPGKTVEGFIGAIIFSTIITLIFCYILRIINVNTVLTGVNFFALMFMGMSFAVVGHLGDLAESLLKRDANVKDSAHLLPEFGGVLDLVDSILPTGLMWFVILTFIRFIG